MKECTFKPQIERSVSPQYCAYNRNQNELVQRQQHDITKRQQAQRERNQVKQDQEDKQLSGCTFQPSLSPPLRNSIYNKSPKTPRGFDQTVYRMRAAHDNQRVIPKPAADDGSASLQRTSKKQVNANVEIRQVPSIVSIPQHEQYTHEQGYNIPLKQSIINKQESNLVQQEQKLNKPEQAIKKQDVYEKQEHKKQQEYQLVKQKEQQQQIQQEQQQCSKKSEDHLNKQQMYESEQIPQKPKAKPFFVLDIITPKGEKAHLELYKDDDIYEKAEQFSQQYNLDEITQSRIEQILDSQMQNYLSKKANISKNN